VRPISPLFSFLPRLLSRLVMPSCLPVICLIIVHLFPKTETKTGCGEDVFSCQNLVKIAKKSTQSQHFYSRFLIRKGAKFLRPDAAGNLSWTLLRSSIQRRVDCKKVRKYGLKIGRNRSFRSRPLAQKRPKLSIFSFNLKQSLIFNVSDVTNPVKLIKAHVLH
jgi:hypothetical protein